MAFYEVFIKAPSAVLDFTANWVTHLGADTISTSAWVVEQGLTKDSDTNSSTTATIWVSGGTLGEDYRVHNDITTVGGRTMRQTFIVRVEGQ